MNQFLHEIDANGIAYRSTVEGYPMAISIVGVKNCAKWRENWMESVFDFLTTSLVLLLILSYQFDEE